MTRNLWPQTMTVNCKMIFVPSGLIIITFYNLIIFVLCVYIEINMPTGWAVGIGSNDVHLKWQNWHTQIHYSKSALYNTWKVSHPQVEKRLDNLCEKKWLKGGLARDSLHSILGWQGIWFRRTTEDDVHQKSCYCCPYGAGKSDNYKGELPNSYGIQMYFVIKEWG